MSDSRVISNCILTHKYSQVVKEYGWVGSVYNHAITLSGDSVFCPCCGVVIDVSNTDLGKSVTVQYSGNISLRFDGLDSLQVQKGSVLEDNSHIGNCDGSFDFQYLTTQPNEDNHRVFLPLISLYTHDPNLVINKYVEFESSDNYYEEFEFDSIAQYDELSNNKG